MIDIIAPMLIFSGICTVFAVACCIVAGRADTRSNTEQRNREDTAERPRGQGVNSIHNGADSAKAE